MTLTFTSWVPDFPAILSWSAVLSLNSHCCLQSHGDATQQRGAHSTTQAVRLPHTFYDGVGGPQAATEAAHASQVARAAVEVCLSPEPVLQVGHQ